MTNSIADENRARLAGRRARAAGATSILVSAFAAWAVFMWSNTRRNSLLASMLWEAANRGQASKVSSLLKNGADPNARGLAPTTWGFWPSLQALLTGRKPGITVLHSVRIHV